LYEKQSKLQLSLLYYKKYTELKDSIYDKDIQFKIAEIQQKYELEKKEMQIELLKVELEKKAIEKELQLLKLEKK